MIRALRRGRATAGNARAGLRSATVLALGLVALAPLLSTAAAPKPNGDDVVACGVPGQVKDLKNHWLRIKGPSYAKGEGGDGISALSVPPSLPGWVYASNGQVVQLSTDGGCHWSHLWASGDALAGKGGQAYTPDVVAAVAASYATGLWFVTYDRTDGAVRPHVYATTDATPAPGNTTAAPVSAVEVGLPPVGLPVAFAVSHTKQPIAYLLLEGAPDPATADPRPVRRLYYTKVDHPSEQYGLPTAVTWQEVATPPELRHVDGMTLSPDSSVNLWVWQGATYAQHEQLPDGTASTWRPGPAPAPGPISMIDVDATARAAIYSPGQGGGAVIHADRGDRVVDQSAVPVAPAAAAHGSQRGVAAVSGAGRTYGYDVVARRWVDVSPGRRTLSRLQMGASTHGNILVGQEAGYLYRFDLYPGSRFLPPPPAPPGTGDPNGYTFPDSTLHGPKLTLSTTTVTVAPGALATTAVDLGVPPDPTPQDVYFLVDTTGSMQAAIDGLKKGLSTIAKELAAKTGGTTCFGVGDVDDYYETNPVGAYTRVLPITCPDDPHYLDKTYAALDGLKAYGGGSDEEEAQTLALQQAATGSGQTQMPPVLPGQSAGWKHDSRVIVLVTDAFFKQGGGYPTIGQAAADLHAYSDIKVVGVQVIDNNDQLKAYTDLKAVATQTDTLAPAAGIDCDGDGVADIRQHQPLVCQDFWDASGGGTALNLAPAIVSLLIGVRDPGTLAVTAADAHHVVRKIDGKTSDQFNLKLESHLAFTLHLTCGADQNGQDLLLPLVGFERARPVAADRVLVRCRAAAVPPPPPPPPPPPKPEPPGVPRPPQPPPVPVAVEPPPPVTNNPPPNLNANAGFSHQEEEQYQVATVTQDVQEDGAGDETLELAMSAVRDGDPAAAPVLLGAAMVTTAAAGYAFAHRRQVQRSLRPARNAGRPS
jgi:hypothetical protein